MNKSPKIRPSEFRAEAQHLIDAGQMPSLDQLLATIGETREKYRDKILVATKVSSDDAE